VSTGKQTPQANQPKLGSQIPRSENEKEMVELSRRQLFWAIIGAVVGGVAIAVTVGFFMFDHIREDRRMKRRLLSAKDLSQSGRMPVRREGESKELTVS
jgi:hypothetical protein